MLTSLCYGDLPSLDTFKTAWNRAELDSYIIEAFQSDWTLLVNAINQGIDSHLEAVALEEFKGEYGKGGLRISDAASLRTLVRRLIETDDTSEEGAIDLASSILSTLDIEWV